MVRLNAGNVLLKGSHKKRLMTSLKRSLRIGESLGNFALTIDLARTGRAYEVQAHVHDNAGDFDCRSRSSDFENACRNVIRDLTAKLHIQRLQVA
jgi:hypothetical protein